MVTVSPLPDPPLEFFHSSGHGNSASLKGQIATHYKDELQYHPRTSRASPQPRERSLLAALAAVSAVVFIAYVCSFSTGKSIADLPLNRKLADRWGGEECEVSQDSHGTGSSAYASSEGQQVMIAHLEALQAQSGNVVPTPSADATTAAPGKVISGTRSAQLETRRMQGRFKRRGEKHTDLDMAAKQSRLETVVEETPLQPPPPPLDPGLDSLIDSVLSGATSPFSEDFWLADETQLHPTAGSCIRSKSSRSGSESASPVAESTHEAPPPPLDPGLDSLIDSVLSGAEDPLPEYFFLDDELQQHPSVDYFIGLRPAVLEDASETPIVPVPQRSPPAPDPNVDTHADSVSSRVEYLSSEDVWIPNGEPLRPTPGSSSVSMSPALAGDSELSGGSPVERNIEYVLPSVTPTLPGIPKRVIEGRNLGKPSLADTSGHQIQRRPPVGAESAYSGPSPDAAEVTMGPPQALTPRPLAFPKERMATSSKESVDESLPSSSRDSPGSWQLPLRVKLLQYSGSVVQSARVEELPTDATVISHFKWLGDLFPGIPLEVLWTHPFYRHPENRPALSTRSFNPPSKVLLTSLTSKPGPALEMCRKIMNKTLLTSEDFEDLLRHAERLCAYAIAKMRVTYVRQYPMYIKDTLGIAFLVLDTLYCAAEVLGHHSKKQSWWPLIVRRIKNLRFVPNTYFLSNEGSRTNSDIARTLDTALEYYRRGIRPPLLMVIGLKEELFCRPGSSKFRAEQWNGWRQDAAQWRMSVEPIVARIKLSTVSMGGKG